MEFLEKLIDSVQERVEPILNFNQKNVPKWKMGAIISGKTYQTINPANGQ